MKTDSTMEEIKNVRLDGAEVKPILADITYKADNKAKPIIIFCHGFKGFKDWGTFNLIAKRFAENGFIFCKFNFSHNGTTPDRPGEITDLDAFGNNNFTKELYDIDQVLNWVLDNDFIDDDELDKNHVSLVGHSRGGTVALIKAGEDKRISRIITWAAPNDLKAGWDDEEYLQSWKEEGVKYVVNKRTNQELPLYFQIVEDYFKNSERYNIQKVVEFLEKPFMVIHGTEDEAVPFEQAIEMKRWNKQVNMELIPHANHVFGGYHPYDKETLPDDTKLITDLSVKFLKGLPERRRRKRN